MRAELASISGDRHTAVDELQLALVYDPDSIYLALELARASLALGKSAKAKKLIGRVLKRRPHHVEALLLSADIAARGQKYGEAERSFRRAAALAPEDERAVLGLAAILERRGRIGEAARVLRRGADRAPQSTALLVALSKLERSRGRLARAAKALERAITRDPGDADLLVGLSDLYERQLRHDEAVERWRTFVEAHPNDPVALLEAARAELWMDRDDRARTLIERLERIRGSTKTDRAIGLMLLSEGRNRAAAEKLAEVVRSPSHDSDGRTRHAYAVALARIGRVEAALSELEHIGPQTELYETARVGMAELLLESGKMDRAEIALRNAIEERPSSAEVAGLLAQVLERKGDVEGAVVLLRETPGDVAVRRRLARVEASILARHGRREEAERLMTAVTDAGGREATYLLGSFLWEMEEHDRALELMQKLVRAGDPEALNFVGYALAERGRDLAEADALVRQALAERPRAAAFIDSLGYIELKRGRFDSAERLLRRAVRLSPRDPEIAEHLGDALSAQGRKAGARRIYGTAMGLVRKRIRARVPGAIRKRDRIRKKLTELGER